MAVEAARLRLTRIDPWSVMKTAFLLSIALGVVTIVSVLMVWSVLGWNIHLYHSHLDIHPPVPRDQPDRFVWHQ